MTGSGYALGIDLGTTYTAAATYRDGRAETVALGDRAHTVPSVILIEDDGAAVVGEAAAGRAAAEPNRVTREFKRSFGDDIGMIVAGRTFSAAELTRLLLEHVLRRVIDAEGARPKQIAVTVPATWRGYRTGLITDLLNQTLADVSPAGILVMPEPAAAAVHYAGRRRLEPGTLVGVYDLGGGTFDATVLRKTDGGFEIAGIPAGSDELGGTDLDHALTGLAGTLLGPAFAALDRREPQVRAGLVLLRDALVAAKESLSSSMAATVPVLLPGLPPSFQLTREQLEARATPILSRTVDVFAAAVQQAGLTLDELDAVLLVGGSSRIPLVARMLHDRLGRPVTVDTHPKYAVCLGAAICAGARLPGGPPDAPQPPPPPAQPPVPPPVPRARIGQTPPEAPPLRPGQLDDDPPLRPSQLGDDPPLRPSQLGDDPPLQPGQLSQDPPRRAGQPAGSERPADLSHPRGEASGRFVEFPSLPGAAVAAQPAHLDSPATLVVDLRASGLTAADDVPLRPAVELRRRVLADPVAAPLTIRLGQDAGYRAQSWSSAGRALAVAAGVLALAGLLVAILSAR